MNKEIVETVSIAVVSIVAIWCFWGKPLIVINRYYRKEDKEKTEK
jgi:hypothetical protein